MIFVQKEEWQEASQQDCTMMMEEAERLVEDDQINRGRDGTNGDHEPSYSFIFSLLSQCYLSIIEL